jgi:Cytochrome P460
MKEVPDIYANPEALVARGQPLPSGAVLVPVHFKARLNEKGELIKDPNGRLVKGNLDRIGVMEKRAGWGAEYPDDMRNGEWEYALFKPDGGRNEQADIKACFECHKPNSGEDFGFTFDKLLAPAAR